MFHMFQFGFLTQSQNRFDFELIDVWTIVLTLFVIGLLFVLLLIGRVLKRQPESKFDQDVIRLFNKQVTSWLMICVVLLVALLLNKVVTVMLFGIVSFWALREFITMTPTRRGDHRTLFWVFLGFTPLQYVLVAYGLYDYYTIVIPVYASLFIPARIAFTSDHKRFLERTAKIQFGLLICVYALSHAAALVNLQLNTWDSLQQAYVPWDGKPAGLLFFLIVVVQFSEMLHFFWDRIAGKHLIAATIDQAKSWEGLIGAGVCAAIFGSLLQLTFNNLTPFSWYAAGLMSLLISVMASSGSMTMAAIKRDRGIGTYGTLVTGHLGVLDRIDAVCFAAPIFFHVTRILLT